MADSVDDYEALNAATPYWFKVLPIYLQVALALIMVLMFLIVNLAFLGVSVLCISILFALMSAGVLPCITVLHVYASVLTVIVVCFKYQ